MRKQKWSGHRVKKVDPGEGPGRTGDDAGAKVHIILKYSESHLTEPGVACHSEVAAHTHRVRPARAQLLLGHGVPKLGSWAKTSGHGPCPWASGIMAIYTRSTPALLWFSTSTFSTMSYAETPRYSSPGLLLITCAYNRYIEDIVDASC